MINNKMIHIRYIAVILVFFMCWQLSVQTVLAKETDSILIPEQYIAEDKADKEFTNTIPLFTEAQILHGVADQVTAYYTIPDEGVKKDAYLSLHFTYSELLLNGSSLTIAIDGEPVKSVFLEEEKEQMTVDVPLPKDAKTSGFHTIELAFHGVVMDNICVDDENTANWLSLTATTALYMETNELSEAFPLQAFPYPYIRANESEMTRGMIVVPENADDETLMAALHLSSMMHRGVARDEQIPIVTEDKIEKIDDHMIVIGGFDQWNGVVKSLISQIEKPTKEKLYIGNHLLEAKQEKYHLTAILANESATLGEKIVFLTETTFREQLTGTSKILEEVPMKEAEEAQLSISLKEFGMPNITISGGQQQSLHYFYPLPTYVDLQQETTLQVRLKVAETLFDETNTRNEAELMILINDVPHSVRVNDLREVDHDGIYEVDVKVAGEVLQQHPYISVQFIGNGLRRGNYCEKPNNAYWIYVDDSTSFSFTSKNKVNRHDFLAWPSPFIESTEAVGTVLAYDGASTDTIFPSLQQLVNHLGRTGIIQSLQLLNIEDAENVDVLQNNEVIFVGDISALQSIVDQPESLKLVADKEGSMQIEFYGFVRETGRYVSWIESSPWNENHSAAFFTVVHDDNEMVLTDKLITFIENNKMNATIIVENDDGQIFTNEIEEVQTVEKVEEDNREVVTINRSLWIGIASVIVISFIVLLIGLRIKRKKDGRPEKDIE